MLRRRILASLVALAALGCAANVNGQAVAWPSRPVQLVIPFPPSGGTDIIGRAVATRLQEKLGKPFVIENKPGAGGIVGTQQVAKAPPDGHTFVIGITATFAINPSFYRGKQLNYDPVKDFEPVAFLAESPHILVINPETPAATLQEYIAYVKANKDKLSYASYGNGSTSHLITEMLKEQARIDLVHVPHNGSAPAVVSTMTGEAQIYFGAMPAVLQQANAGRLRALAITSAKRRATVPEIPTVIEGGLPGYEILIWNALFAPRATPPAIIARLNGEVNKILELPDIREAFNKQGAEVSGSTPEQLAAYVASEYAKWAKVVAASGAKVD